MTLQQLSYILELSKHNSISAAAQALNISQPSLSTAIRDLEKEFSLTLVERNRHGITFTPAGLEFLHYAGHILSHAAAMHDHFQTEKRQDLPQILSISSQHYPFADEAFIHAQDHHPPAQDKHRVQHPPAGRSQAHHREVQGAVQGRSCISGTEQQQMQRHIEGTW